MRSFKDLGLLYNNRLSYTEHIHNISINARRRCMYILRTFKTNNLAMLSRLFTSYVRPILEMYSECWSPTDIRSITLLEDVQRFYSRMCLKRRGMTLCYSDRLVAMNLDPLALRRTVKDLVIMYKIARTIIDLPFQELFVLSNTRTRGHRYKVLVPLVHNQIFKQSFLYRNISIWNSLPDYVFDFSIPCFSNFLRVSLIPVNHFYCIKSPPAD